ncbi:MAG: DUF2807 domain-containing protein [Polyangiaceae bacterium]
MRILTLVTGSLLLCLGSAGCDLLGPIIGSGHELRETREVEPFSAVVVGGSLEAQITLDPEQEQLVEISGDDNIVPEVRARVSGGELVLDLPPSLGIDPSLPLVVTIHAKALSALATRDSARADANAVEGSAVSVASKDSSELSVGRIAAGASLSMSTGDSSSSSIEVAEALGSVAVLTSDSSLLDVGTLTAGDSVELTAGSSSDVTLRGSTPVLEADLSDSTSVKAAKLSAAQVIIRASSSSSGEVCATSSLDATLSDSSSVVYTCNPENVTKSLEDSSSLTEK